mmetsp:Transcript_8331/g.21049  ORF Transcript_8331/g.21049 Transcript_8331/m.21049 type:complete len:240 (-) Transcript_8331:153-872(-)
MACAGSARMMAPASDELKFMRRYNISAGVKICGKRLTSIWNSTKPMRLVAPMLRAMRSISAFRSLGLPGVMGLCSSARPRMGSLMPRTGPGLYCDMLVPSAAFMAVLSSSLSRLPSPSRSIRRYANCTRRSNVSVSNLDSPYTNSRNPMVCPLSRSKMRTMRSVYSSRCSPKMLQNPWCVSSPRSSGAPSTNMSWHRPKAAVSSATHSDRCFVKNEKDSLLRSARVKSSRLLCSREFFR